MTWVASLELASRGFTQRELDSAPPPPPTRAGCAALPRPCPSLRCRYHLPRSAELRGASCALDVADRGGVTLEEIGALYQVTMQRAGQVAIGAMLSMADGLASVGVTSDDVRRDFEVF